MLSHAPKVAYPYPPDTTGQGVVTKILELEDGLEVHEVGDFFLCHCPKPLRNGGNVPDATKELIVASER